MKRIASTLTIGLIVASSAHAAPRETEPAQKLRGADVVDLDHRLEPGVYVSCEDGTCRAATRDTWSNLSQAEVDRRVAEHPRELRIVEDQLADLPGLERVTDRAIEHAQRLAAEGRGEQLVDVTIYLEERPFDFQRLRPYRRTDAKGAFDAILAERRAQVGPDQEAVREQIEGLGGEFGGGRTFANHVTAAVPAADLAKIAFLPRVVGVELTGRDVPAADGRERRLALGLPASLPSGLDGGQGSTRSGGGEVKFGVIEVNNSLNNGHLSFLDWAGGPNRVVDTDRCVWWFPAGRQCQNSATTTSSTHGTMVTSIVLGSLEQGQDAGVTDPTVQQQRSGVAREGEVHYYSYDAREDLAEAFEEANEDNGIDIVNLSAAPTNEYCDNGSYSGVRDEVRAATDAGILIVVAAGNDADNQPAGTCTVSSYGAFPDTMAIGATNDVTSLASLDTVGLSNYSGRGSVSITLDGGRVVSSRMVDVIVTGDADSAAGSGTSGTTGGLGTSFAAPQVAGVAGLLKDWVNDRGGLGGMENDPYALRTLLSVMGDGVSSTSGGGTGYGFTVSDHSGFGHLRFVDLDSEIGSGGWGLQRRYVTEGQVIEWSVGGSGPESTSVNGWKFAALWDVNNYGGSPDIKFELVDNCPAGGGSTVIRTAARHPLRARMRMRASEMSGSFHNRCLYLRATVEHASGTVPLYTADYYYTTSRDDHDM